jgi:hypothetical protein
MIVKQPDRTTKLPVKAGESERDFLKSLDFSEEDIERILEKGFYAGEVREILSICLSEDEVKHLHGIRHEMNAHIKWGDVVNECFPVLLESMEALLFQEGKLTKEIPFEALFADEKSFLLDSQKEVLRRNFVLLLFVKKLLGVLKTRVKQELGAIRTLDWEEELDLRELLVETENAPAPELDKEEEPEEEVEERRFLGKPIVYADLFRRPQVTGNGCSHTSTRTHFRRGKKLEFCRLCRTYTSSTDCQTFPRSSRKKEEPCLHPSAQWVPGQEGKVACCGESGCGEILPNPEKYRWTKSGLEPFGDNPQEDEVILLDEVMGCES